MSYRPYILIVDDKQANLFALKNVLSELENIEIVEAENGNDALIAILNHDFALAILDVQMPDIDGYELAEYIRNEPQTQYLPIIFLSAIYSDDFHVFKGYQSGAVDFLTKPFKPEILLSKVRIFLQIDRQRHEIRQSNAQLQLTIAEKEQIEKELQQKNAEIERKNRNITASINYAKRIQDAMLPQPADIAKALPDSFVLYKPKEVVSGDFYWLCQIGQKTIVTAVDCTGHGVPGAFMSLIGNDLLHGVIELIGKTEPKEILAELHQQICGVLSQGQTDNQDGMNMALCVIDAEKQELGFAGSRHPLFYIQNQEFQEIKGDKLSIGGAWKRNPEEHYFTQHSIAVGKGQATTCYIFSDGFQDQFNEEGKKFTRNRFKELLFEHYEKPMPAQKQILEQQLEAWKGKEPQTDDILVLGFKIPPTFL